jgi:chemotaxis protein CheZ
MAQPRKIFRIEQTAARLEPAVETTQTALQHAEIMRELTALRAVLASLRSAPVGAVAEPGEADRLTCELNIIAGAIKGEGDRSNGARPERSGAPHADAPMSRIDHELNAVVSGTEQATQKILTAAEEIDVAANTLSAALSGKIEQGLAQDIQDLVIRIYEACNFQDLIGQRVAKVLAALKFVEEHIARVLDELKTASAAAHALHGPRLDGDCGHASQDDIDTMFAS